MHVSKMLQDFGLIWLNLLHAVKLYLCLMHDDYLGPLGHMKTLFLVAQDTRRTRGREKRTVVFTTNTEVALS